MPSKVLAPPSHPISVTKLVLELEADSASFVTLRLKQDRRRFHLDLPATLERRREGQPAYTTKPASR